MIDKYNKFVGYSLADADIDKVIGNSKDADYIKGYLADIGATFCIEEKNYVDKEYLIDYSKFYARSFDDIKKSTFMQHQPRVRLINRRRNRTCSAKLLIVMFLSND